MTWGTVVFWGIVSIIAGISYFLVMRFDKPLREIPARLGGTFQTLLFRLKCSAAGLFEAMFGPEVDVQGEQDTGAGRSARSWFWLEWTVILLPIWAYCLPFLNLGSKFNLPGPEAEYFETFDQILEISIKKYGQFPLWNPYFSTGAPYIAHPMLHAYNPFITIPVLFFGALNGFKIAVFLAFVIAGLATWWLGHEMGLSRVGRVWCALMYTLCGVAAAKFIQGHYLMVLGFGWIPFCLAALMAAARRRQRKYVCIAALGMAMLFFCGNVYYAYYLLYVVAIFAVVYTVTLERKPLRLKIDWAQAKILAASGALALGLIAIQLLPLLAYRDQYIKASNTSLSDSQSIADVALDFISPEPFRPGAFSNELRPEEFYAYVGWWPFLAGLFIPLSAHRKGTRKRLLLLALIIFTFLWIDVKDMPWKGIFQSIPLLYQFRYPSRMVVVGALGLVLAGGLGLEAVWAVARERVAGSTRRPSVGGALLALAASVFMVSSVGNLISTSQPWLAAQADEGPRQQVSDWLRGHDQSIYYVSTAINWHRPLIGDELRYLNIWDAIRVQPDFTNQISDRDIAAQPKYFLAPDATAPPPGGKLIHTIDGATIYEMPAGLPFAFTVERNTLMRGYLTGLITSEVAPATSVSAGINDIEVVASSDSTRALVVLSSFAPDWQLIVDGKPAETYDAFGYLAAAIEPGQHHFKFTYRPVWFYLGLGISLFSLLVVAGMLFANTLQHIARERFRTLPFNPLPIGPRSKRE